MKSKRQNPVTAAAKSGLGTWEKLCDFATEPGKANGLDAYLKGEIHRYFLIAEGCADLCRAETACIAAGDPSPRARFVCCRDCFANILTNAPKYDYPRFVPPYVEEGEAEIPFKNPGKDVLCDQEALEGYLEDHLCELITAHETCTDDVDRRDGFICAFHGLLTAAARLAKRLDCREAALDLLEAVRLTPCDPPTEKGGVRVYWESESPLPTVEEAYAAYDCAKRGLARLWTAVRFDALKPLPKTRTSRKRT